MPATILKGKFSKSLETFEWCAIMSSSLFCSALSITYSNTKMEQVSASVKLYVGSKALKFTSKDLAMHVGPSSGSSAFLIQAGNEPMGVRPAQSRNLLLLFCSINPPETELYLTWSGNRIGILSSMVPFLSKNKSSSSSAGPVQNDVARNPLFASIRLNCNFSIGFFLDLLELKQDLLTATVGGLDVLEVINVSLSVVSKADVQLF